MTDDRPTKTAASLALAAGLLACAPFARGSDLPGRRYFYEDIFTPFYTLDASGKEYTATRPGAGTGSFPARKPADAYRVFVIGGSIAGRYMTGPHPLTEGLGKALPTRRTEVLNAGMAGYDSAREALVLEEVLDYSPDLIVLLSCHNELIGSPPVPLWILHAQDRLSRLAAFRRLIAGFDPVVPTPPDARKAAAEKEAAFESNLRAMIRNARAKGAQIAVAAPPLDYRDAPSDLRAPLTRARFWTGWLAYLRGRDEHALMAWGSLLADLPGDRPDQGRSLLENLMARAYRRSGSGQAGGYFTRAMEDDWYAPGRCSLRSERAILRIAGEEGAVPVDLDGDFRRRAAPDMPGLDMFDDAVHWLERDNAAATAAIVDALRAAPQTSGLPWDDAAVRSLQTLADKAAAGSIVERDTLATLRYALSSLRARISVTPIAHPEAQLSWRSAAFLETVYDRHPRWFRDPAVLARIAERGTGLFGRSWGQGELTVAPAMADWYAGETLLRRGDARGALRDFDAALAADPSLDGVRLDRALALTLLGDAAAARGALDGGFDEDGRAAADALRRALDGAAPR